MLGALPRVTLDPPTPCPLWAVLKFRPGTSSPVLCKRKNSMERKKLGLRGRAQLCDLRQVSSPLWAAISQEAIFGFRAGMEGDKAERSHKNALGLYLSTLPPAPAYLLPGLSTHGSSGSCRLLCSEVGRCL